MVKFSIQSCNSKETKALPVGRRGPINSMGWRVPINSKHVLSWSHLCLKPPSMSHAQPYVRVAHTRIVVVTPLLKAAFYEPCTAIRLRCSYQTALHKGVTTALRANAVFVYHTHTHAHTPTHTFPLYCILGTIGPIEPKFCMHMECDQTIKSHKNINLIWGHLGYANEGQRSNLPLFCISVTLGPIEPRFCVHMECDQANICHNNIKLIWGHLGYANEGQRSNLPLFCISETVGLIEPKFCMRMECDQTIKSHKNINLIWGHLGYANEGQRSNLPLFCISLTGDQFSPRFWYVVAETILYKIYDIYFSFWWRHHSEIFYLRNRWSDWAQILYAHGVWSGNYFIK